MVGTIKLTRKFFTEQPARLYISPSWVSNGHWAMPRQYLHPTQGTVEALRTVVPDVREWDDDEKIVKTVRGPLASGRSWVVTPWQYTLASKYRPCPVRLVRANETGEWAGIDERYAQAFGLVPGTELTGETVDHPFAFGGKVLMGVSLNALPALPVDKVAEQPKGETE